MAHRPKEPHAIDPRKLPSGRWKGRVQYWDPSAGQRKELTQTFATEREAVAARDAWIGWTATERSRFRWRIVNNNRFLMLPGVQVAHLASHILGLLAPQILADWVRRYGYRPGLLETFVESPWSGTCYRAANWQCLGETAGRGRQDRHHEAGVSVKTIGVYPLGHHGRTTLVAPQDHRAARDEEGVPQ